MQIKPSTRGYLRVYTRISGTNKRDELKIADAKFGYIREHVNVRLKQIEAAGMKPNTIKITFSINAKEKP